ncbi:MAG: nucleotidyltransferase family protein [Gammaproteobacteria bacterium]|nr:nucleotidyltransferase family protein [Gammaproteobacteria bacterium]
MKAFILAAGYGTRMRPLTNHKPKPLLKIAAKSLLEHHLTALADAGFQQVVINTAYLGEQIEEAIGNGSKWNLKVDYSREGEPLETGGAIEHALPILGEEPFLLVNGDVFCDFPFERLSNLKPEFAHIVLVPTPEFKQTGDFSLTPEGILSNQAPLNYTYSGIGIYSAKWFLNHRHGKPFPLGPVLREQADNAQVTAELFQGVWHDIGTPERLAELNQQF